jgi:hypothetical protein
MLIAIMPNVEFFVIFSVVRPTVVLPTVSRANVVAPSQPMHKTNLLMKSIPHFAVPLKQVFAYT